MSDDQKDIGRSDDAVDVARDEIERLAKDRGTAAAQSLASLAGIAKNYRCYWLFTMEKPSEAVLAERAVAQACADFRAGVRVR